MDAPDQSPVDAPWENERITTPIPEDWGGDGRSGMNLSGRRTAIASEHLPRRYQFFNTQSSPIEPWQIPGVCHPTTITRQRLSWHDNRGCTAKVMVPPEFSLPAGRFTADLELFVLQGVIQVGEWNFQKHCYGFIPAGVRVGPWQVLSKEPATLLWMTNQHLQYENLPTHSSAKLSHFIPLLDSKLLSWGRTDTTQFLTASKKWVRKAPNGGGTWLLTLLPHYDGQQRMIQAYNEEAYGLAGECEIGDCRFAPDHFGYCPSFSTLPRHISENGGLFFVRVDRDLSHPGTVLSYAPQPLASY